MKNFAVLVAATVPKPARGKPVELWWQDEARIGEQGILTYAWADKGSRPPAPRDYGIIPATLGHKLAPLVVRFAETVSASPWSQGPVSRNLKMPASGF